MTPVTTTDRVKAQIAEVFGVEPGTLEDGMRLKEDLGADSLDVVDLAFRLEHEFKFTAPDQEFDELQTVGQIVHYVQQKIGGF